MGDQPAAQGSLVGPEDYHRSGAFAAFAASFRDGTRMSQEVSKWLGSVGYNLLIHGIY